MKIFSWLNQISNNGKKLERRRSLGEYKRAESWSKYLVSKGGEIKGEGEEEWSADMSQLFIGNKFAMGRHSRIYKGVYKQNDVAIKLLSHPEEDGDLAAWLEKQFISEVGLLFRLQHPNVITLFAACKKTPIFCIITEYCAGGSLRKYLHQQEPYSLPLTLILKLTIDIARGMKYLHSQGILHRDLKSENLFLGEDMSVKVADFGISCLESQCGSAKGFTGTYRWMAPEMIKEKRHTKKVDVYSFGIVLWELFTALTPFDNMTPEQAAFAVSQKALSMLMIYWNKPSACSVPSGHSAPCHSSVYFHEARIDWNGMITFETKQAVSLFGRLNEFHMSFHVNRPQYILDQGFVVVAVCCKQWRSHVEAMENARPPLPPTCPMAFCHLINRCWSSNPDKRPFFDEILALLESFAESFRQDPEFFSSYKPEKCRTRSWPRCISIHTPDS